MCDDAAVAVTPVFAESQKNPTKASLIEQMKVHLKRDRLKEKLARGLLQGRITVR